MAQGGDPELGEGHDPDDRWMLRLIYQRAINLDEYLMVWLNEMIATTPSLPCAAIIASFGGPASYLCRPDDSPAFKQVSIPGRRIPVKRTN